MLKNSLTNTKEKFGVEVWDFLAAGKQAEAMEVVGRYKPKIEGLQAQIEAKRQAIVKTRGEGASADFDGSGDQDGGVVI